MAACQGEPTCRGACGRGQSLGGGEPGLPLQAHPHVLWGASRWHPQHLPRTRVAPENGLHLASWAAGRVKRGAGQAIAEARASTPNCAVGCGAGGSWVGWFFFFSLWVPSVGSRASLEIQPLLAGGCEEPGLFGFVCPKKPEREKTGNNPVFLQCLSLTCTPQDPLLVLGGPGVSISVSQMRKLRCREGLSDF